MATVYQPRTDSPAVDRVPIVLPGITLDRSVALGAAWGVAAWSTYALLEYILCSVWPLFTESNAVFAPLNWRLSSLLFNAYWVLGAGAGGLCAALATRLPKAPPRFGDDRARLAGKASLYLALLVNLLAPPRLLYGAKTVLLIDLFLLATTLWAMLRPESRLTPWVRVPLIPAILLIQLPTWLNGDALGIDNVSWRRAAMAGTAVVILAAGRFLRFRGWTAIRHIAANLAVLVLLIAACALRSGSNRVIPPTPSRLAVDPGLAPVLFVSFDTTRADHVSAYGYPRKTTPNLEEFARHATLYTNALAAADWTLPSHASMFTGLYPSWHGAHSYGNPSEVRPLPGNIPSLPAILKDRGVFTAGVGANKAFLSPKWGLGHGFQSFNMQSPVEVLPLLHTYYLRHGIRRLLSCCIDTLEFDTQYRTAQEVNGDAIAAIEEPSVRNRSFFLFVNYMDAHQPYVAQVPAGLPLPSGRGAPAFPETSKLTDDIVYGRATYTEPARTRNIERYDAGIAAEDAGIGELFAWLKRRGLYDRSLIIVTADHGEAFGEHRLAGHANGTYQDQVWVPLLIKYPHQSEPVVNHALVSHVDLMPTVLDALGLPVPANVQGVSLLNAPAIASRPVFAESFTKEPFTPLNPRTDRTERAVRIGPYKLILSNRGKHELFDIVSDPQELHNLTARNPAGAQDIETALRQWERQVPAPGTRRPAANQDQMRLLRGLGYVH